MSAVIWLHWDALSSEHPVMRAAPEDAKRVYVWDAEDIARHDWSLKRCVFVLECLEDMDVEILEGRTAEVLNGLNASEIFTAATPDPYLREQIGQISAEVTIVKDRPFTSLPETVDMKRFFRYWNKAKKSALQLTDHQASS